MRIIKLVPQNRGGLFSKHDGVASLRYVARATILVIRALQAAGAKILPLPALQIGYEITLGTTMPDGIVAVTINQSPHLALRLIHEPAYPGEHHDYWQQVDWTPCPKCGAPVVWYEAGYVPGYRVCTRPPHHHSLAQ